jgi:hypothetical protein
MLAYRRFFQKSAAQNPIATGQLAFRVAMIGMGLFVLAFLVRLPYIGDFMTVDEERWIHGAGQFLLGLHNGSLTDTYWHFFPGITITWGEAIILWLKFQASGSANITTFVNGQMSDLAATIGSMRLSPVILTALATAGVYWLARPIVGGWPAFLGAGLLAVDPFFVAHSRIVNGDAAAAGLMMLVFLAFAWLWQTPNLKTATLAGSMAGLALLTKLPAPLILPWVVVLAGLGFIWNRDWRFWVKALLVFGLATVVTFVALWPAMWVAPINTLLLMYRDSFEMGEIGAGHDTFFLGQISKDPGWLFYPYVLAFRLTPITSVGLVGAIFWLWRSRQEIKGRSPKLILSGALWFYIIFIILFASLSPKKLDRYVMAVIPASILLASLGLEWGVSQLKAWRPGIFTSLQGQIITPLLLILGQILFVISDYPYVLNYYNPLLGGYSRATSQIPIGWGEGIEQAIHWLNQKPDAEKLNISTWYANIAEYYMVGNFIGFSETGSTQLEADYTVFYINQVSRELPFPALVRYFQQREPVYTVAKSGVPYVWVYKAPGIKTVGKPDIVGRATLYGYTLKPDKLESGAETEVTLYFLTQGELPGNETFTISLESGDGQSWGTWQNAPINDWRVAEFVEWQGRLQLPKDMSPGNYLLVIKLMDNNISAEVTRFDLEEELEVY